ncbi:ABC transporter ATP-binding protein [Terrarubrum flagellatum]|uniref:ABC transporter ATP-binding protein n=1 Tax=Terrirubrum flagellatum TaxID=2895980 RepID=UPI003144E658
MTSPLLEARGVSVRYGKVEAVRDVSFAVPAGAIVSIIGANGAGKSTLLNAIMGALPCAGEIRIDDKPVASRPIEQRVEEGLSLVPERRELFGAMSIEDNLLLGGFRRPAQQRNESLEKVFALFPRLRERRRQEAGTLSGGERQMLAMGRALMARPRVLMLDEPSLGLAPRIVRDILDIVVALRDQGVAILLVEQNAAAALKISDYAYVMEFGRFALEGTASDLAKDERIADIYFGAGERAAS